MLEQRFMWIRRPYPFSSTKPNSHLNTNTQTDYISSVKKCVISQTNGIVKPTTPSPVKTCNTLSKKYMNPAYTDINSLKSKCNVTSPVSSVGGGNGGINSEGMYIIGLNDKCEIIYLEKYINMDN